MRKRGELSTPLRSDVALCAQGATVMDGAVVQRGAMVAAGALVTRAHPRTLRQHVPGADAHACNLQRA